MRPAGLLVWRAHQLVREIVRPGVTTKEIDEAVDVLYRQHGAVPLFQGVLGKTPFPSVSTSSTLGRLKVGRNSSLNVGRLQNIW